MSCNLLQCPASYRQINVFHNSFPLILFTIFKREISWLEKQELMSVTAISEILFVFFVSFCIDLFFLLSMISLFFTSCCKKKNTILIEIQSSISYRIQKTFKSRSGSGRIAKFLQESILIAFDRKYCIAL